MKKGIILLAATAILTGAAHVQAFGLVKVNYGVKFGLNFDRKDPQLSRPDSGGETQYKFSKNTGFHFGAATRISILHAFHIQPEILYNHSGYDMTLATGNPSSSVAPVRMDEVKVRTNRISVPMLLGTQIAIIRVQAGPVFNIWSKSNTDSKLAGYNTVEVNYPSVGYMIGVGLSLWKLDIDARLDGNFKRPRQHFPNNAQTKLSRNNITLGVGYMF